MQSASQAAPFRLSFAFAGQPHCTSVMPGCSRHLFCRVERVFERAGYQSITVLDITRQTLSLAKTRVANNADAVSWIAGDVTATDLPVARFELRHDRAVFHFLTELEQERRYQDQLLKALKPECHLTIGTFAPEMASKCSGLPAHIRISVPPDAVRDYRIAAFPFIWPNNAFPVASCSQIPGADMRSVSTIENPCLSFD